MLHLGVSVGLGLGYGSVKITEKARVRLPFA